MTLYDRVRDLPVQVDGYRLERCSFTVSAGWERVTTTVVIAGGGHEGRGEDISYEAPRHDELAAAPPLALAGAWTIDSLSRRLGAVEEPYTRWAFESAALDLALRQAGCSFGAALGRPFRPVRFVMSTGADLRPWLAADPSLEFKVDAKVEWTPGYMAELAATGRVRVVDLKAYYVEHVALAPDAAFYAAIAAAFDGAIIEDPSQEPAMLAALAPARERLSFDAIIHSVADIEALAIEPRWLNIKPSRFGSVERLLAAIEHCEAHGIAMYGGGQFELGVGRPQIQAVASLFYADAANDVAPSAYNTAEPGAALPRSPLLAPADVPGFGA
jgi:L-alanine-DL-glutamate epimerase-like enolase superfamily enzyme